MTPKFCLGYIHSTQNIDCLSKDQRAEFAVALQKRSRLTWADLRLAPRHALGTETLPVDSLKIRLPSQFADQQKVLVFRYAGLLPMVGVRVGEIFHILGVEDKFGNLYDH